MIYHVQSHPKGSCELPSLLDGRSDLFYTKDLSFIEVKKTRGVMAGNVLGGVLYDKLIVRSASDAVFNRFHIQTLESRLLVFGVLPKVAMANNTGTGRLELEICSGLLRINSSHGYHERRGRPKLHQWFLN